MGFARVAGGSGGYRAATGTTLRKLAEGSLIKINEESSPVEFYVAKHDYEPTLNGTGRTLVVRKDCHSKQFWYGNNNTTYSSSYADTWLNGTYKPLFDDAMLALIGTTKFKNVVGNGDYTIETLERGVFLLSATELGQNARWITVDSDVLDIYLTLKIAYMDGDAVSQWTRSPRTQSRTNVVCIESYGLVNNQSCMNRLGMRPCFTLPADVSIDDNGLVVA